MYEYKYVAVEGRHGFARVYFKEHREIIEKYAKKGYRFVGYIPTTLVGYGVISGIDLIFEKEVTYSI